MHRPSRQTRVGYYPSRPPVPTQMRKPTRRMLGCGLMVLAFAVLVTSVTLLARYFGQIFQSRQAASELERIYASVAVASTHTPAPVQMPTPTLQVAQATTSPTSSTITPLPAVPSAAEVWPATYPENPRLQVSQVFDQLQSHNSDIVAWLKIDGVLEEPVVQRDNQFYLTHNVLKQPSITGALFLDERCALSAVPTQIVIYGHNMKEGAMFGNLKQYARKGADFYHQHAYVACNTLYENGEYVIFAISTVDIRYDHLAYIPFWMYPRFPDVETFEKLVDKVRALSILRTNIDVCPGDRLLTLSTCTNDDDRLRMIVMARKIRPNEDRLALNMAVQSATFRER